MAFIYKRVSILDLFGRNAGLVWSIHFCLSNAISLLPWNNYIE